MSSPPQVRTATHRVRLREEIGRGGEASVWRISQNHVAKIYSKDADRRRRKIEAMVRMPPRMDDPPVLAWPKEALYDVRTGEFRGFVMPAIHGARELNEFINPRARAGLGRELGFELRLSHLVTIAANVAQLVGVLHGARCVVGDLNDRNFLADGYGRVFLVDVDSIQVTDAKGEVHRCHVGSPLFTPPELHTARFESVVRLPEHDRFGLAVLLFMLLMNGQHPFRAIPTGDAPMEPDEANIRAGRFAYGGRINGFAPSPHAPPIAALGPEVAEAFERTFLRGHVDPHERVSAEEWVRLLGRLRQSLVGCRSVAAHEFHRSLRGCPFCPRQQRANTSAVAPTLPRLADMEPGWLIVAFGIVFVVVSGYEAWRDGAAVAAVQAAPVRQPPPASMVNTTPASTPVVALGDQSCLLDAPVTSRRTTYDSARGVQIAAGRWVELRAVDAEWAQVVAPVPGYVRRRDLHCRARSDLRPNMASAPIRSPLDQTRQYVREGDLNAALRVLARQPESELMSTRWFELRREVAALGRRRVVALHARGRCDDAARLERRLRELAVDFDLPLSTCVPGVSQ